jgi:hypothetical protein
MVASSMTQPIAAAKDAADKAGDAAKAEKAVKETSSPRHP